MPNVAIAFVTSRKVCSLCASKPRLPSACPTACDFARTLYVLLRFSASGTLSVDAQLFSHIRVLLLEPGTFTRSFESAMPLPKSVPYLRLRRKLSVERCLYGRKPTMREPVASKRSATHCYSVETFEKLGRSPSSSFL